MKKYEFTVTQPDGRVIHFTLAGVKLADDIGTTYAAQLGKQFPGATVAWREVTP